MSFSKMIWASGGHSVSSNSWDFWSSYRTRYNDDNYCLVLFPKHSGSSWYDERFCKTNNMISYYAVIKCINYGALCYRVILVSRSKDAVSFWTGSDHGTGGPYDYEDDGGYVSFMGYTWYYSSGGGGVFYNEPPVRPSTTKVILPKTYNFDEIHTISNWNRQPTIDLLERVYSVPFHESYVVGNVYTLVPTDTQRTVRKAISTMLHRNISLYGSDAAYTKISDEADNIINRIMQDLASKGCTNGIIYVYASVDNIEVGFGTTIFGYRPELTEITNATAIRVGTYDEYGFRAYTYWEFEAPNPLEPQYIESGVITDWTTDISYDYDSGSLVYNLYSGMDSQTSTSEIPYKAGICIDHNPWGAVGDIVMLTNLGVDL